MKILDYVSPRALKEWESNMEAELDGDRKKLAHEKHAGGEASTSHRTRLEGFDGLSNDEGGIPSMQIAREARWYMADDFEVDVVDDGKQSALESEWGTWGLGAIAHAWVVKRLENMAVYDVEGRGLVRYLQMRWEGNWPPDRNPTWESEENIPSKMRSLANKVTDDTLGSNHGEDGADDDVRDAGVTSAFGQEGDDEGEPFIIEEEQVRPAKAARAMNGLLTPALGSRQRRSHLAFQWDLLFSTPTVIRAVSSLLMGARFL
ncbi:hypothetical protein HRG_011257 [Hirsutella rhossiliensis]|uniref:Chromo domain-containing protein n=1 Tax=Hirsutella rhossiliensis TaxID=111463 RepID=A0A9P8SCN8_9HYPO|nr:uncharacterized protein HRG_11257 [Hirsutella rhossiliensis]KAH0957766.1 hypothetical protein HRG_11257 [Hirsutella rhossiliensis]